MVRSQPAGLLLTPRLFLALHWSTQLPCAPRTRATARFVVCNAIDRGPALLRQSGASRC
jgi:hypothetical protein